MAKFKVTGMTCGHCVRAVTEAVQGVAPTAQVDVSLQTGEVSVTGAVDASQVIAAIASEGYEVVRLAD
jgi:copper chaperone